MDTVQHVVILPHEVIGEINPFLHGHFAEHLANSFIPACSSGRGRPSRTPTGSGTMLWRP